MGERFARGLICSLEGCHQKRSLGGGFPREVKGSKLLGGGEDESGVTKTMNDRETPPGRRYPKLSNVKASAPPDVIR